MKSIKAKAKAKKANGRFGSVKFPAKANASILNADLSSLRQPIDISVSTLKHVTKLLETGSEEVKAILAYECDLIYECRVCRSLFRSLVNFLSHKRVYCKEKYNATYCSRTDNACDMPFTEQNILSAEKAPLENCNNDRILRSQVSKEEQKKDLSAILEHARSKEVQSLLRSNVDKVILQDVNTNPSAVYQTVKPISVSPTLPIHDLMQVQVAELDDMLNRNVAILGPDGQLLDTSHPERNEIAAQVCSNSAPRKKISPKKDLVCTICNSKFATEKTLVMHTKALHTSNRMCYPCPCCTSTFTSTWSVYKHLFKVHRKSNDQVRKLRSHIQEKAFCKETTVAEELERERNQKSIENSAASRVNETQSVKEWMDHFESDAGLQCCGGCGKHFDRKAALSSHSQHCQRRIAACNEASAKPKKSGKSSSESPKLADQKPNDVQNKKARSPETTPESSACSETGDSIDISIRVEAVTTLTEADWNMMENGHLIGQNGNDVTGTSMALESSSRLDDARSNPSPMSNSSDHPEIIFSNIIKPTTNTVNVTGSRKRKMTVGQRARQPSRTSENSPEQVPKDSDKEEAQDIIKRAKDIVKEIKDIAKETKEKVKQSKDSTNDRKDSLRGTSNSTKEINGDIIDSPKDANEKKHAKDSPVELNTSNSKLPQKIDEYTLLMEQKVASMSNVQKLQCLLCKRKFSSVTNLRRHIAIHIGWNRYRCKLCDYKCFVKCDCVTHCNKVHNTQNHRALIDDLIEPIPNDDVKATVSDVMPNLVPETTASKQDADQDVIEVVDPNAEEKLDTLTSELLNDEADDKESPVEAPVEKESERNDAENDETVRANEEVEAISAQPTPVKEEETEKDEPKREKVMKLESNEQLRRMVMEVIFGLPEPEPKHQEEEEAGSIGENPEAETPGENNSPSKERERSVSRAASDTSSTNSSNQDKPQRPIRNRTKILNEDFVYDLKDVPCRKDGVAIKRAKFAKMLRKKLMQVQSENEDECNMDIELGLSSEIDIIEKV